MMSCSEDPLVLKVDFK